MKLRVRLASEPLTTHKVECADSATYDDLQTAVYLALSERLRAPGTLHLSLNKKVSGVLPAAAWIVVVVPCFEYF